MENIVAAAPVQALDFERRNQAYEQGSRWAETQISKDQLGREAALTLGATPTFDEWTEYAREWKDGYIHARPGITADAADQAFSRQFIKLVEEHGVTKPKSTSVHAEKKAAERSKKTQALFNRYAETTVEDLREQRAAALQAAAKGSEIAEKLAADLKKVLREKTKEENKAHGEALKEARAKVKEAAGKCTDLDQLAAALDCLSGGFDIHYSVTGE